MNNNEMKKKILEINKRTDLTHQQKNLEISKLFKQLYNKSKLTKSESSENKIKKCIHYNRKCLIQCPNKDCLEYVNCRLCHNEDKEHILDRHKVTQIKCKECNTIQLSSNKCTKCKIEFGKYYCKICNLWDSTENKDIYHCDSCKICRVGKKEDYIHCPKCNLCIKKDILQNHKCIDNGGHSNCPICSEDLFTSTNSISILRCGHCIHVECLQEYTKHNYNCPICKKSLNDLTNYWKHVKEVIKKNPMPEEYKHLKVNIFCNDCNKKSIVSKHFMGNECEHCNSFNTNILKDIN